MNERELPGCRRQADADQVRRNCQAGDWKSCLLVDPFLNILKQARRGYRCDGVNISCKRPGVAIEDDILDARDFQKFKSKRRFIGTAVGADLGVDAVPVAFIVFFIPASDDAVLICNQQGSEAGIC